jgi:hypothetical protein
VNASGADQTSVLEYTIAANPSSGPSGPAGTPSGSWVTRGNLFQARRGLAVSNPPGVTNFLSARSSGRDARQDSMALWIARNIRAARAPVPATDAAAMAGRTLVGNGFNIPSLLSVHETAPYFYSGLAQTLEEVLNGSADNFGGVRHHFVNDAQQQQRQRARFGVRPVPAIRGCSLVRGR